ncbi:MAG: dienelactone hydrolase family protein [Planctomycetales bacterium]|nr:dienelactone hydrolase family protein [Planctomycetales bacterium]
MRRFIVIASILLCSSLVAAYLLWPRPIAADVLPEQQFSVDGIQRKYRVVLPHSLPSRAPVVLAFHGVGDSTELMAEYSRLDRLAASEGFLLVYLATHKSMWDTIDATNENILTNPDVLCVDELIEHLSENYDIDRDRVYALGMSNGASFAQLLAIARSEKIAAVVAHSGPRPRRLSALENRFPIMLVVGAEDWAAPVLTEDAQLYRENGHEVELIAVSGLRHAWSRRHNEAMWAFLSQKSLITSH